MAKSIHELVLEMQLGLSVIDLTIP